MPHVVVLGGGISGLAAAHRLLELQPDLRVTLVEAQPRLGGLLGSERQGPYVLETGPDSILTEKPWAVSLIKRLGLGDEILRTRDRHRGAYVVTRGKLERIPAGFSLLAPTDARAFLRSPILSWPGKLRALAEPWIPTCPVYDQSLEHFVVRRFGRELLDRLAQPLVGGIYGADPTYLSLRATMPRFLDMERSHGSVTRGLQAQARERNNGATGGVRYGMFVALEQGMQSLIDALQARLQGRVRLGLRAVSLLGQGQSGYQVELEGAPPIDADAVIVALPSHAAAPVLQSLDAELAQQIASIPYGSAATLTCAWPRALVPRALDAFGFVVPHKERRPILACTWSSEKYAGRAPSDKVLLRVFFGDDRVQQGPALLETSDENLTRVGLEELRQLMGIRALPEFSLVVRYPKAMPWYLVGHRAKVACIERYAAMHPGLELAGNAYDGVGIPDAIRRAELAAERVAAVFPRALSGADGRVSRQA